MSETYHVRCLSRVMSPITHMDRAEGNEALIAREPVVTPAGVRYLPRLSGNALRHRMVREPLARYVATRWGLEGKLTLRQANFLFHGGTLSKSNARLDLSAIERVYRLFPSVHLLGGCLPDAILPGGMSALFGVLVCRENAERIRKLVPDGVDVPGNLRSAESFIGGYQYTRSDAARRGIVQPATEGDTESPGDSSLMIFSGQSVCVGAEFVHGFILQHVSILDLGALLLALDLWKQNGATVGGMSARGHGKLDTLIALDHGDGAEAVRRYVEHVDAVKDEGIAWLEETFAALAVAEKEKKKKGKAHATAESDGVA